MKRLIFYFVCLFILIFPFNINAKEKEINLYLFYGRECPHCEEEMEWLDAYLSEHDNITLYKYEVWHNEENQEKFELAREALDSDSSSVPFLAIGENKIVGFSNIYTPDNIHRLVKEFESGGRDLVGEKLGIVKINNNKIENTNVDKENKVEKEKVSDTFDVPLLGKISAQNVSLPLLGVILGFIDGFNPCALWILIFLITMLLGMKDRKKMWILGLTFLITSALIYTLFMVSWLSFALVMNKVTLIQLLIGMFAVIFGTYNIIKFLKSLNKDTGCEVVNESKRKQIINKIKHIVTEKKFIFAFLGVIVLACSVNLIELMCSLGLPVVYTQVLSLNDLTVVQYGICIFIYILFYLIDDLLIFFIAMKTLKIKAISNRYLKYSHLIGGLIMLGLGLLMIFKPEWLMFNF